MPRQPDGKLHLDRVVVRVDDGRYVARACGEQESNTLAATAVANGLVLLPDGDGVAAGDTSASCSSRSRSAGASGHVVRTLGATQDAGRGSARG